jgi:beta-glucosidase
MVQFPQDFLWGAATSAHQVEGNNDNCDWWQWEKASGLKEPSGEACRHYQLYEQDFDLAKALHHNAHRFSLEWSRIEPGEGVFSPRQISHYREVICALRQRGIEPIVTLHHFTSPVWFALCGGWESSAAPARFLRFVREVAAEFAADVRYWATINEPLIYVYYSYLLGSWPPQKRSFSAARRVTENLIRAHIACYRAIHDIYRQKKLPRPMISIAKNVQAFEYCGNALRNRLAARLRNEWFNLYFVRRLNSAGALDFIGINYYSRNLADVRGWGLRRLFMDNCRQGHNQLARNSLGWDIYPEGLYKVLMEFKAFRLPLMVLENGICTGDDNQRRDFIRSHLLQLGRAMDSGTRVLGYIHWSLLDNYEWDKGFGPRFGLIEVDYRSYERRVRESARYFGEICRSGKIT